MRIKAILILLLANFKAFRGNVCNPLEEDEEEDWHLEKKRIEELSGILEGIRQSCGEVCDMSVQSEGPGIFAEVVNKEVNCRVRREFSELALGMTILK